jgi:translation initiation factor 4G
LNAFLNGKTNLQLIAVYALQVYCFSLKFPKGLLSRKFSRKLLIPIILGMLLRWFTALYDLSIIEEEAFLRWKEDITDEYQGKGEALFQVNTWLTWLQTAESEDEDEE